MAYLPPINFVDFGSVGNIGQNINDYVQIDNTDGYSTIAFHCTVPTGGVCTFECTYDGINWTTCTMRSIEDDIYSSSTFDDSDFIGSIAAVRAFRVRVTTGGAANGTFIGRMQRDAAVLEGQEFSNPPHRFGYVPINKDASFTTAQTGAVLWTPASGKKIVVTDCMITASGNTDGQIKIFDETDASGKYIYIGTINLSAISSTIITVPLAATFVSSAVDNEIKLTTSSNMTIDILLKGYEIL